MKNLLVDALRQAGDEGDSSADEPVVAPAREDVSPAETAAGADDKDLKLVESTVLPQSMAVTPQSERAKTDAGDAGIDRAPADADTSVVDDESVVAARDGVGDVDPVADPPDDEIVVDPTMVVPALSLSDAEAAQCQATPSRAAVAGPGQNRRRQPWIALGRWSPALCLIAMSATAGSVVLYNKLAAQTMNVDLGTLPQQSVGDLPQLSATGWRALPATDGYRSADESNVAPEPVTEKPVAGLHDAEPTSPADVRDGAAEASLVASAPASIEDPAYDDVTAAFEAYEAGRFDIAEQRYRDALVTDSHHRHALAGLAAVLQRTGRVGEALPIYDQLLALDPDNTSAAASLLAHANSDVESTNEVRIKMLIQRHPESAALHFAMGVVLAEQERWADAHESFLAASQRSPDNAEYSYNVAVSAERLGRAGIARSYYRQVLATAPPESLIDVELVGERLQALGPARDDRS